MSANLVSESDLIENFIILFQCFQNYFLLLDFHSVFLKILLYFPHIILDPLQKHLNDLQIGLLEKNFNFRTEKYHYIGLKQSFECNLWRWTEKIRNCPNNLFKKLWLIVATENLMNFVKEHRSIQNKSFYLMILSCENVG